MFDLIGGKAVVQIGVLAMAGFSCYWFLWRPVTQRKASYHEFFQALEDVNATPFFKFRMLFKGLKMELWSNALIIIPLSISVLSTVEAIPTFLYASFLPEWAQSLIPTIISAVGVVTLFLNRFRSTPPGSPVPDQPTSIDVPTITGKPDVVIVADTSGVQDVVQVGVGPLSTEEPDEPDLSPKKEKVRKRKVVKKKKKKAKKRGRR